MEGISSAAFRNPTIFTLLSTGGGKKSWLKKVEGDASK
jgi:hypothetical protein